jgi:two-component system aerobic respiration control protein ArcA
MNDSSGEKKQRGLKISELMLAGKSLTRQIEQLKKDRFLSEKVVNLADYRLLRRSRGQRIILVVDHESDERTALVKSLEAQGYSVLSAGSEEELAEVIADSSFDLVILDLSLSWLNGFEFCRLIKRNDLLRQIFIMFCGKDAAKDQIKKAFEAGCDDYAKKPFEVPRLLKTIKYFLGNK